MPVHSGPPFQCIWTGCGRQFSTNEEQVDHVKHCDKSPHTKEYVANPKRSKKK